MQLLLEPIHVLHLLVVLTVSVEISTVMEFALVCQISLELPHPVDQNVSLALTVRLQKLVLIRSVVTHAQERVELEPLVK